MSTRNGSNTYQHHDSHSLTPSPENITTSQNQSQPLSESSQYNYAVDSNETEETDNGASRYIVDDAADQTMSQHNHQMNHAGESGGDYSGLNIGEDHGIGMTMGRVGGMPLGVVGLDMDGMGDLQHPSMSPRLLGGNVPGGPSTGSTNNPYSQNEGGDLDPTDPDTDDAFEKLQHDYTNVGDEDLDLDVGVGTQSMGVRDLRSIQEEAADMNGFNNMSSYPAAAMPVAPSSPTPKAARQPSSTMNGKKRARTEDAISPKEEGEDSGGHMVPGTIFKNAFNAADVDADEDEDEDEDEPAPKRSKAGPSGGATSDGGHAGGFQLVSKDGDPLRRKIRIEYITDKSRRHITFSKRKSGIMKKAYELSILTGVQLMLLVVSETGLVYTFTTAKLQPIVKQPEGMNLIQACLNAPEGVGPDGTPTSIAAIPTVKKDRKAKDKDGLAIRPLKLDAASIQNLEHSATAAGHGGGPIVNPETPISAGPGRPRKRLPSGKAKKAPGGTSKRTVSASAPSTVDPSLTEHHPNPYPMLSSPSGPPGGTSRGEFGQGVPSLSPLSATQSNSSPHMRQPSLGTLPMAYPHQQQGHSSQQPQHHQQQTPQQQQQHPYYGNAGGLGVQPQLMGGMTQQQQQHQVYYQPQQQSQQWHMDGVVQDGMHMQRQYDQHLQPPPAFQQQQRHVSNNAMDVSGM